MDDLISRKAAIDAIKETSPAFFSAYQHETYVDKQEVIIRLRALPSIQLEQRKMGKWIASGIGTFCSNCHYKLETTGLLSRCPHCGARMGEWA